MSENNDILLARLAEGLDSTAKLTQALLSDLRDSETDFAAFKTELNILKENVKSLSQLIREGDGTSSLLTRMALFEHRLEAIEKTIIKEEEQEKEEMRMSQISINREQDLEAEIKKNNEKLKSERQASIMKIVVAVILGIIGLAGGYLTNQYTSSSGKDKTSIEVRVATPPVLPAGSTQGK